MISLITAVATAIGALAGLIVILYKHYSPKAKARRKAKEDGKKAIDNGDVSGVTGFFDRIRLRR